MAARVCDKCGEWLIPEHKRKEKHVCKVGVETLRSDAPVQRGVIGQEPKLNHYAVEFNNHTPEQRINWMISQVEGEGAGSGWLKHHLGSLLELVQKSL